MIRINDVRVPLDAPETALRDSAARRLGISPKQIRVLRIARKSIDARDKGAILLVYALEVEVAGDEAAIVQRAGKGASPVEPQPAFRVPRVQASARPVVVGFGPCGIAAALYLAHAGLEPIVLERGAPVQQRMLDIGAYMREGLLNEESNLQFGEGGAGAFSDGKLTTGIKDPLCQVVLDALVAHGAPEEILYLQRPHIGTDKLPQVVASMRRKVEALGGQVLFHTRLTGLETHHGAVVGVRYEQDGQEHVLPAQKVLLALGHSARDTQRMLRDAGLLMSPKPFSMGVRIEHPQELIDRAQYGASAGHEKLPPAEYHLSARTRYGRGVYTFCMCPGGRVMGASSEQGHLCVNGMSRFLRDAPNANSALLVDVRVEDYFRNDPLDGFAFQRRFEQLAYQAGGGGFTAVVQRVADFLKGQASRALGAVKPSYLPGVVPGDVAALLPDFVAEGIREGILRFDRQIRGFALPDAVLTGVETRSSSPVRVTRDDNKMGSIAGVFPAGEGAGHAGGIMSAAVDGLRSAQALIASM